MDMPRSKTLTVFVVYHFCIVIQACVLGVAPVTATYEIGCLLESRLIRPFCSYRPLISSHVFTVSIMALFGTLDMHGARESLCWDAMRCLGTVGGDVGMLVDGTGRLEWG